MRSAKNDLQNTIKTATSLLYFSTLSWNLLSSIPLPLLYSTSTLPLPYPSLLHGANWTQRELDTMIFELVRTLLHDLIRHMPTGHKDLWASGNVTS